MQGKKKIFEGKNVNAVLEEEIEERAEKLEELQKSSGLEDLEVRNCNNFDKQACLLQRRLEKIGGLSDNKYVEELQELAEPSLSISNEVGNGSCVLDSRSNKSIDVILRSLLLFLELSAHFSFWPPKILQLFNF